MPRARSRGWTGSRHPGHRPARRLQRPAPGWARAACQPRRPGDLSRLRGTGLTPSTRGQPRQEGAAPGCPSHERTGARSCLTPRSRRERTRTRTRGRDRIRLGGGGTETRVAAAAPASTEPEHLLGGCSRSPPGSAEPAEGPFPSPQPRPGVPRGRGAGGTEPRLLSVGERGGRGQRHRALSAATGAGTCPHSGTPRLDPPTAEGHLALPDSPPAEGSPSSPVRGGALGTPGPAGGAPPGPTILPVPAAAPAGASRQREGGRDGRAVPVP
ncbi:translation initiation factor IF-2-like [Corvus cornix cornix]|uniref:translation initiation factor IF-2-like n=1 Tax=Corvus cornix cornix TaxID=932674 RepID=UPI00194DFB94|nr:translation initiation factor IF-2-like [Corvus cornix cornix]